MSYQVSVYLTDAQMSWHTWWENFLDYEMARGRDFDDKENRNLNEALKEYNAIDEAIISGDDDSPYIIFETEQDFLMFVLKFT